MNEGFHTSWAGRCRRGELATLAGIRRRPFRPIFESSSAHVLRTSVVRCAAVLVVTAFGVGAAGCGAGATKTGTAGAGNAHHKRSRNRATPPRPLKLSYRPLFSLPAPLRDPASAVLTGTQFALVGGLDAADVSSAGIEVADPQRVLSKSSLPLAQHDAQAAALDGKVYVFGGGSLSELDHIISFDPASGAVRTVGSLPHAQSDVAVTESGGTAYIVGGYDGTNWLNTILAWRPGSAVTVAGHLPVGLRYSSATRGQRRSADHRRLDTHRRQHRDLPVRSPHRPGQADRPAPHPSTHAGAATLGSSVYLVGGRGDASTSQTSGVWSINPQSGAVHRAGHLPQPLSDTGCAVGRGRDRRRRRPVAVGHGVRGGRAGAEQRVDSSAPLMVRAAAREAMYSTTALSSVGLRGWRTGISRANWSMTAVLSLAPSRSPPWRWGDWRPDSE